MLINVICLHAATPTRKVVTVHVRKIKARYREKDYTVIETVDGERLKVTESLAEIKALIKAL